MVLGYYEFCGQRIVECKIIVQYRFIQNKLRFDFGLKKMLINIYLIWDMRKIEKLKVEVKLENQKNDSLK